MTLVDTSVWIDFFNGSESLESAYLRSCIADGDALVIPGVVLTEILLGMRTDGEARKVAQVLTAFDTAPQLDAADYLEAAGIYRACRTKGFALRSTIDCLIAQLCLRYRYELLARDRDFEAIAKVFPLRQSRLQTMVNDRPPASAGYPARRGA